MTNSSNHTMKDEVQSELKHINRHKPCLACEKMYMDWIKRLEKQIDILTEMLSLKKLSEPIMISAEGTNVRDLQCLHNGCNHDKNPVCHLYCPHCGPVC